MSDRLHKLLADYGYGSRRDIEQKIREGRIVLNGSTALLGDKASTQDIIDIDGIRVTHRTNKEVCAMMYHKPCGVVVTREDQAGRQTIFSILPPPKTGRWVAVGRLDLNTSGLLLVCNNGELAHRLMHPSYQLEREYKLRARGHVSDKIVKQLLAGVRLNGSLARFKSIQMVKEKDSGINRWYKVILCEGRNREVRRLWESQDVIVNRLIRIRFGTLKLDIPTGTWRDLESRELDSLNYAVGLA